MSTPTFTAITTPDDGLTFVLQPNGNTIFVAVGPLHKKNAAMLCRWLNADMCGQLDIDEIERSPVPDAIVTEDADGIPF